MERIYKYPLDTSHYGEIEVLLPKGATILTIQNQNGVFVLWARVDAKVKVMEPNTILMQSTGKDMDIPRNQDPIYITTVQFEGEVYHFFKLEYWSRILEDD